MRGEDARKRIEQALELGPTDYDELGRRTKLSSAGLRRHLRIMEAQGRITTGPGGPKSAVKWLHLSRARQLIIRAGDAAAAPRPGVGPADRQAPFGDALQHPETSSGTTTRERILHMVHANPGIHKTEVSQRLGLARNAIDHHLNFMKYIMIIPRPYKGCVRLFPAGMDAKEAWAIAVLHDPCSAAILRNLRPHITVSRLAELADASRLTVRKCLRGLVELGLISPTSTGYRVEPPVSNMLAASA